jgi:4-amino-4-deoxy-L-arabinose transferase-like glycosyltransferase
LDLNKNFQNIILLVGFAILSVPLWLKVDALPLQIWDEARNAVNAIEMYYSGEFITRTFHNTPETYNLKPPFLTWLQVASMKIVGVNELAIRLPSVIATICSMLLVFCIVLKMTESKLFGFLASAITVTSLGFYGTHVGRFGDHDALLLLFVVLLVYATYLFSITFQNRYIYLISLSLLLGVFVKSISILVFVPAILAYLVYDRKLLGLIKNKHTYMSLLLFIVPILLYYMTRESLQPGYLDYVWNDELFPRYNNTSKNLKFDDLSFWYYFKLLASTQMSYWIWGVLFVIAVPILLRPVKKEWVLLTLCSVFFLFVISNGTKNFWYSAPVIPVLSCLISYSLFSITKRLSIPNTLTFSLVLLSVVYPYKEAYAYAMNPFDHMDNWESNGISLYVRDESRLKNLSENTKILLDNKYGLEPHLFYLKKIEYETEIKLNRVGMNQLVSGDTLLIAHKSVLAELQETYIIEELDNMFYATKLLVVTDKH